MSAIGIKLLLCGDVMTGRGIDQILPHPGDPTLHERYIVNALQYVALAERANGPIPKPAAFAYVWGDALAEMQRHRPDIRIINLETSITRSQFRAPKGINYRMNPANAPCLAAFAIDCCALANNHVMDWGSDGLLETLNTLHNAGIATAGAGGNPAEAAAPAIKTIPGKGRVAVLSLASTSSGTPAEWAARDGRPGIDVLPDLSQRTIEGIAARVRSVKQAGDVVVASIHWGGNWGYRLPPEHTAFAHALIDAAGIDIVHGHSSHHAKPIEVYRGKLVLHGCGDFLNDYEGIEGYEEFRGDLVLAYLPVVEPGTGRLVDLTMVPFQLRKLRLCRATGEHAAWLAETLSRQGIGLGTRVEPNADHTLTLEWH